MEQDGEAKLIGFYLLRGHSLEELLSLSTADRAFYYAAMKVYTEGGYDEWLRMHM